MAIYGRFGDKLSILRLATLEDVQKLENRQPDKQDQEAVKNGSYVVIKYAEGNGEAVYHQAFLKADGGFSEITKAVETLTEK